jgi:hypothetical protein
MSSLDDAVATQLRNIEVKYGKSLAEWKTLVQQSGKAKHGEIVTMLKSEYGMTHGDANTLAHKARETDGASIAQAAEASGIDPIDGIYEGKKAPLRPIHDALMAVINQLGGDFEIAPKKGYVSLRRKKQFAMIQPTTATRVDVGLVLKELPTTERLESAASFNAMFTHRVRLSNPGEIDDDLKAWLKLAYDSAG